MVHDAITGGEDQEAELTRREELGSPLLEGILSDGEARRDHTALVEATSELDDNLASAVIIDNGEVANVT